MVLKPNMAIAGKKKSGVAKVGEKTKAAEKLRAWCGARYHVGRTGGRGSDRHLDAMNRIGGLPWKLTFAYGRALQPRRRRPGRARRRTSAAQRFFIHRVAMNGLASK